MITEQNYSLIDEAMLPFSELITNANEWDGFLFDKDTEGDIVAMSLERLEVELPIELDIIVDETGKVLIGAAAPIYTVETTNIPVFHKLSITTHVKSNV